MLKLDEVKVGSWVQDKFTLKIGQVVALHAGWPNVAYILVRWNRAYGRPDEHWELVSPELSLLPMPPAAGAG